MAVTTIASANTVQQWDKAIFREWVRDDQFGRYTGRDVNKIIQVKEKLLTMPGHTITISLVTRLTGAGQTGDNTLEGNEESIGNYGMSLVVNQLRHAVRIGHYEQGKSQIEMFNEAGPLLKDWRMSKHRDDLIACLLSPNVDGITAYASTGETAKNTWLVANSDRVLFGSAVGNYSGVHATDLGQVDSSSDTLDSGILSLVQRRCKAADPHIRPVKVNGFGEYFVWFVGSLAMRDLETDSVIINAQQYAAARGRDNPLFQDGDVLWRGNIVHEVPEIDVISSVGAASIDVAPCFCCGAQALAYVIGERTHSISDEFDYKNEKGVGIAETKEVAKCTFNSKQHGVHTVYVSGVADS